MSSIKVTLPVPAANGVGAGVDTSILAAEKTVVVGGAFDASVTLEVSVDGGATWAGIATFFGPGEKLISFAAQQMRVRVDAYSSGTPTVEVGAEAATGNFSVMNVPGAPGNGTALDTSAYGWCNTIIVSANPGASTINIQVSQDGVVWSTVASFSVSGAKVIKFSAQFARIQRVNVGGALAVSIGAVDSGGGAGSGFNIFGDGSDGDVTLVGGIGITRDMYYNNLDLAGFTIQTQGSRVYVKGELIFNGGRIQATGAAGTAGAGAVAGVGGAGGPNGTTGAPAAGGNGNVAGAGVAGNATNPYAGSANASSGAGGAGASGAGGAAAVSTALLPADAATPGTLAVAELMYTFDRVAGTTVALLGGAGGGGGGGEAATAGGGGGGQGGRIAVVCAKTIILDAGGSIEANGGKGGDGSAAGDAGGGGGGAGGVISMVYKALQDAGGSFVVLGGIGGTALGTGANGVGGDAGSVYQYQV